MKSYALWGGQTNNLIEDFDNEHDALALVLDNIEFHGPHIANCLFLNVEDADGNVSPLRMGRNLPRWLVVSLPQSDYPADTRIIHLRLPLFGQFSFLADVAGNVILSEDVQWAGTRLVWPP